MQTLAPAIANPRSRMLRVLTYNVHSCRGADRRPDPARIADVIAACEPDVIALQELDVGRLRTGHVDQAEVIARHLMMSSHFHPALHIEEEKYGDAILTALPSRLVKAAALPSIGEPRGAIWVEIEFGGQMIQVINTHFGLRRRERIAQACAIIGQDWAGNTRCRGRATLLLGDFNSVPVSRAYSIVAGELKPVISNRKHSPPTFPARFPLLRLDHMFTNEYLVTKNIETIVTPAARLASDHLPLLVSFGLVTAGSRLPA